MTTTLSVDYNKVAQEFKEALASAIDGLVKAGEVYVKAIDIDPTVAERLQEEFKDVVPAQAWAQFEALGRKHIHPQLVLGGVSDSRKTNMIKGLPYSVQSRVFDDEKFELLVSGGDVLPISVLDATIDQCKQLIDSSGGSLRSLKEQKAFLEELAIKDEFRPQPVPYKIGSGGVVFMKNTKMTKKQIQQLLQNL